MPSRFGSYGLCYIDKLHAMKSSGVDKEFQCEVEFFEWG